jgi:hypothetical protein
MSTIPISTIVAVNPSVLAAAGSAVDLNGVILTQSPYVPIGTVKSFALADDVGAFFGYTSIEYSMAQVYFKGYEGCTKVPGKLYFAQYNEAAVAGYLRGASLSLTLTQLQALSGSLTVAVDGTNKTAASISLSAATSFANAATIIGTALSAAVTWDTIQNAFVVTSGTTGASSSVGFATGTLSAALGLTSATGAVTSAGAVAAAPATFMPALAQLTQNWALFTTAWESSLDEAKAFAAWTNSVAPRYGYVSIDSDPNALIAGNTSTLGYYLQNTESSGTIPAYSGTADLAHAAFVLGYAASLDFDRTNGRATLAFRTQSGLTPAVTNATNAQALQQNGYLYFGAYANATQQFNFFYSGAVSGSWTWLDTYLNQIWMNANLQLAMINLLMSVGSIPYNQAGYNLIAAACQDPINAAINFGAIRTGVALSTAQVAEIQYAIGRDVSATIFAKGYYLYIQPATAAIRVTRASPSMTLFYADGQSVQRLALASIEIQ